MKRRDYDLIVRVIRRIPKVGSFPKIICLDFVDELGRNNGNFNEQAFRKDCGITK